MDKKTYKALWRLKEEDRLAERKSCLEVYLKEFGHQCPSFDKEALAPYRRVINAALYDYKKNARVHSPLVFSTTVLTEGYFLRIKTCKDKWDTVVAFPSEKVDIRPYIWGSQLQSPSTVYIGGEIECCAGDRLVLPQPILDACTKLESRYMDERRPDYVLSEGEVLVGTAEGKQRYALTHGYQRASWNNQLIVGEQLDPDNFAILKTSDVKPGEVVYPDVDYKEQSFAFIDMAE